MTDKHTYIVNNIFSNDINFNKCDPPSKKLPCSHFVVFEKHFLVTKTDLSLILDFFIYIVYLLDH